MLSKRSNPKAKTSGIAVIKKSIQQGEGQPAKRAAQVTRPVMNVTANNAPKKGKKMTEKADMKMDKKAGVKEGSKKDLAMDTKMGMKAPSKKKKK